MEVVQALKTGNLESPWPVSRKDFSLMEEFCMNYSFCVIPGENGRKTFRSLIVNDADTDHPYRSQIDINLEQSDADELANELLQWINNPATHFIWKL